MIRKIKRVQKGQTPTLLEADKANELIDAINMLLSMQVKTKSTGAGEVIYGQNAVTIVVPTFDPDTMPRTKLTYCSNGKETSKVFLNPPERQPDDEGFINPDDLPDIDSGEDLLSFL